MVVKVEIGVGVSFWDPVWWEFGISLLSLPTQSAVPCGGLYITHTLHHSCFVPDSLTVLVG